MLRSGRPRPGPRRQRERGGFAGARGRVSVAPSGPLVVGVNVTGTSIVCPVVSVAGSGIEGVPIVNCDELEARLETISGSVAVSVAVRCEDLPTVVVGNSVAGPDRIGVTGEPNAST